MSRRLYWLPWMVFKSLLLMTKTIPMDKIVFDASVTSEISCSRKYIIQWYSIIKNVSRKSICAGNIFFWDTHTNSEHFTKPGITHLNYYQRHILILSKWSSVKPVFNHLTVAPIPTQNIIDPHLWFGLIVLTLTT